MNQPCPGAVWRRGELMQRLAATLDLALQAIPHLGLTGEADPDSGEHPFLSRAKFVCETALVLRAAATVPRPTDALSKRVALLADQLRPLAREEEILGWVRLRPSMAPELGVAHLCLNALGIPDPEFDQEYRAAMQCSEIGLAERVPWKDLEAVWHRDLGAPLPDIDFDAATRRTAYNQGQDVVFGTREAAYAVTHGLIYAAGFGTRFPRLHRPLCDLLSDADAMLARCLDEDDFDLGAEVLLTWPYTRSSWSPGALFGLLTMLETEDRCGILPSMTLRTERFEMLGDPQAQARYYFQQGYHTAYVMGLLLAATLTTGLEVPKALPAAGPACVRTADRLRSLLPPVDREPLWLSAYDRLEGPTRGAVVSLLADAGVRRAIRSSEFGLAREIVSAFLEAEVPGTSMVVQASELLARLSRSLDRPHSR